jgi:outer membrane protein assembly factor BamB
MTGLPIVARALPRAANPDVVHAHAVVDFLTEIAPIATPPEIAPALLCDLAYAAADLARLTRQRTVLRLGAPSEPWELGLERTGRDILLTIFQGGASPEVAVHERRVDCDVFTTNLCAAMDRLAPPPPAAPDEEPERQPGSPIRVVGGREHRPAPPASLESVGARAGEVEPPGTRALPADPAPARDHRDDAVSFARRHLQSCLPMLVDPAPADVTAVAIEPTGEVSVLISADVILRTSQASRAPVGGVLRADLLALLFKGRVRFTVGDRTRELADVFVFVLAEQLAELAFAALEAWTHGRAFHRRLAAGGAICGVRLDPRGAASVTLGGGRATAEWAGTWTFPAVDVGAFAQGVVAFGRALARSLSRRDRAQAYNLRLTAFRGLIRELSERLRDATRDDSKVNAAPETYRAFAAASLSPQRPVEGSFGHARLRFAAKWVATVPSIDLRATFLCGDALVVGASRESCCLHRTTGEILWQKPLPRAISVVTPLGLARLDPDGALRMHDLSTGDVTWATKLAPRVGASASGAVIAAPGLPRMLVVSEGAKHLVAVDLHAGEIRWRHAARRGGVFRLRRAGKLVIVACGEPALSALDVVTGEVVWRFCDRRRFASHVAVDRDALFAIAGGGAFVGRGGARLHHLDPWSGAVRYSCDLPTHVTPVGAPLLAPETVIVVTHGRAGTTLYGFDRRTGELRYTRTACTTAASCMVVDDLVIINSEGGELVALDAGDGSTRYRHVFSMGSDGDRPRRLEPVLRSGALFVPQSEVHVVRPRDGTLLGQVPTDLIPDLLRVDERCDVYVVEESGHLAAFGAAPRLTLVHG